MQKKLCPKCGSGKIVPVSDGYFCQDCGNTVAGENELLGYAPKSSSLTDVSGSPMTAQELALEMGKDFLQRLYSGAAKPIGQAVIDAGFASRNDTDAVARLIRAGCMGAWNGVLQEVEAIAGERQKDAS
jgi:hypothetical protein